MWSSLGSQPGSDEAEITVIGPGHGESVVVHLSRGEWLVVDSCVDTTADTRTPAPLKYLRALGVHVDTQVKLIVVSHWDDDHARGISAVFEACKSARLCGAPGLTERDFDGFVEAKWLGATATGGANVRDMRRILELAVARDQAIVKATPARTLIASPHVRSWSPSDHENGLFLAYVARMHPKANESMRKAIPGSPNLTSIVLSIDWDNASALLGADMETHADSRRGWAAVVSEGAIAGFKRGNVVKVPHHGSHTGHDPRMWSELLVRDPVSVIAPYGRGAIQKRPPKPTDLRRINKLSSATFLTAAHRTTTHSKRDYAVNRSLREGNIKLINVKRPLGIVRLRRKAGGLWHEALFGAARRVK